jgi:hypothetical protein
MVVVAVGGWRPEDLQDAAVLCWRPAPVRCEGNVGLEKKSQRRAVRKCSREEEEGPNLHRRRRGRFPPALLRHLRPRVDQPAAPVRRTSCARRRVAQPPAPARHEGIEKDRCQGIGGEAREGIGQVG